MVNLKKRHDLDGLYVLTAVNIIEHNMDDKNAKISKARVHASNRLVLNYTSLILNKRSKLMFRGII